MRPPVLTRGPMFLREWSRAVVDYIVSIIPIDGSGVTVADSPTGKGRAINVTGTGNGEARERPIEFSLYDASARHAEDGGLWVGVRFGIVNCYRADPALLPWPEDYDSGSGYKYELAVDADGLVWVAVTNDTSGDYYQASAIAMGNGATLPSVDATGYLTLGNWTVTDGVLTILSGQKGAGNQMYNFCGYASFFGPA